MSDGDKCERCGHSREMHHSPRECNMIVEFGPVWCSCWDFVEPGTAKQKRIAELEAELRAMKDGK